MSPIQLPTLWLHLLGPGLLICIAVVMYRKRWIRLYPLFFVFICSSVARFAVFLPLGIWYAKSHSISIYRSYFYSYWYWAAAQDLLVFAILYRVLRSAISRYPILSRWTSAIYMLALALCLIFALVFAPASIKTRGVLTLAYPLWQSSMLLRAGLLAFLFLFAFAIGITFRDYLFGIAAGFGLQAFIILVVTIAKPPIRWVSAYTDTVADLIAAMTWFVYLFLPRRKPAFAGDLTGGSQDLNRWKEALSEFLRKWWQ